MWYKWITEELFNQWHEAVKAELNLPKPGQNAETLTVDEAVVTDKYTDVVEVATNDWRAFVEDDVAALIPSGLGTLSSSPPIKTPEEFWQ